MSATVWWTRSGALGSAMQRVRRSAIPSRRSMSASISTPASDVSRPPSKATRTALPAIDVEEAVGSCRPMARSAAVRDRLRPSGQARPSGVTRVDVGAWLRELGLDQYEQAFRDNDIDTRVLPGLTADDLKEIGVVSVGHRRLLLQAIAALQAAAAPVAPATGAAEPVVAPVAHARPQAERRQLTVMFADLVGSTALASRLDPEEMRDLLRAYQNAVAGEIVRLEGHVAKFMGDGVLAYFGWPAAHEDEAERAVRAALAIAGAVAALPAPEGATLRTRIGIATGMVVVGDLVGEGAAQ